MNTPPIPGHGFDPLLAAVDGGRMAATVASRSRGSVTPMSNG